MNTSEQLYHLNDTLNYLVEKFNNEIRLMKSLLKKILDRQENCTHCYLTGRATP